MDTRDALDRDEDDRDHLDRLRALVSGWLDQLIPELHPLRHPDARWQPAELVDVLEGVLKDISGERYRVSHGPVMLDDEA